MARSIYIHIPFCSHICYYCDFNKVYIEGQPVDQYIDDLVQEFSSYHDDLQKETIETIYVGGGTPSTLTETQIKRMFNGLYPHLDLSDMVEITFEINPNDVTREKLLALQEVGVNRLSMGIQSFNNNILKKIGREHTGEMATAAVKLAQEVGFDNISIDLIFRLPNQDLADFENSLNQALALNIPHYSIYSLILENKTVFYNLQRQGKLPLPSQDLEADMYELAISSMEGKGFEHYEISNYSQPGYESKHNLATWQNLEYFGFGAGAHGYLDGTRYQNHGPIQHYLSAVEAEGSAIIRSQILSRQEQIEEQMFLGLRKTDGVSRGKFKTRFKADMYEDFYKDVIEELLEEELVLFDGEQLKLTHHGMFIGNDVFQRFLLS